MSTTEADVKKKTESPTGGTTRRCPSNATEDIRKVPWGTRLDPHSGVLDRSSPLVAIIKSVLDPAVVCLSLYLISFLQTGEVNGLVFCIGIMALLLAGYLMEGGFLFLRGRSLGEELLSFLGGWVLLLLTLVAIGYFSGFGQLIEPQLALAWAVSTPVALLGLHAVIYRFIRQSTGSKMGLSQATIIICATMSGQALANAISRQPHLKMNFLGFFDDRPTWTLPVDPSNVVGNLEDVPDFVRKYSVARIYITLPMTSQPRILALLDALKDTTASIFFVPDLFVFDLIQARFDDVGGVPVISVCESPFEGLNGLAKRLTDILLSTTILMLIWPLLLAIALAVKLTSTGPAIFRQKRYGLDGREIVIYKFRTMTVMEDGGLVNQATRNDVRFTRIGGFLRRTSLDELPQFINVLQGRMSVVGPRPHASAHNERYRKLIKGYMVRHKVRPGITGWAQVNGARGETDTLDKMERRIAYDLDYLRNWSVSLDLKIILQTMLMAVRDNNAY